MENGQERGEENRAIGLDLFGHYMDKGVVSRDPSNYERVQSLGIANPYAEVSKGVRGVRDSRNVQGNVEDLIDNLKGGFYAAQDSRAAALNKKAERHNQLYGTEVDQFSPFREKEPKGTGTTQAGFGPATHEQEVEAARRGLDTENSPSETNRDVLGYINPPPQTLRQRLTGFISRPDTLTYHAIIGNKQTPDSKRTFKAVFFQYQNTDIVSHVNTQLDSYEIVTQGIEPDLNLNRDPQTRASILAPNELTLELNRMEQKRAGQVLKGEDPQASKHVYAMYSRSSFHPKIGYVKDDKNISTEYAFIGTQNITSALSHHNTIESLIVVDRYSKIEETRLFNQTLFSEIETYTDLVIDIAKEKEKTKEVLQPGELLTRLDSAYDQKGLARNFVYADGEIGERIRSVLEVATKPGSKDTVFISMGEITGLLSSGPGSERLQVIKTKLMTLAEEGRLHLITDGKRLNRKLADGADIGFVTKLMQTGSLHLAVTGMLHDKTVAIFDPNKKLKFFSISSANMSESAMGNGRQTGAGELAIANTEVGFAFGYDQYSDNRGRLSTDNDLKKSAEAWLASLVGQDIREEDGKWEYDLDKRQPLVKHLDALSQGSLTSPEGKAWMFGTQYYSEDLPTLRLNNRLVLLKSKYTQQQEKIKDLEAVLSRVNQLSIDKGEGDAIRITRKYATDLSGLSPEDQQYILQRGELPLKGLTVEIRGLSKESAHSLNIDLAVTKDGAVIVSDLNKIITGANYVNASAVEQTIFGATPDKDVVLKPEANIVLDPIQTTAHLVATIRRVLVNQAEDKLFTGQNNLLTYQAKTSYQEYTKAAKTFLEGQIASVLTGVEVVGDKRPPTLESYLDHFLVKGDAKRRDEWNKVLNTVIEQIATGFSTKSSKKYTSQQIEYRRTFLIETLESLRQVDQADLAADRVAEDLLFKLAFTTEAEGYDFSDIRKQVYLSSPAGQRSYEKAARTQSRSILTEVLSPYLAVHEQTYSHYQAEARIPVYGESRTYEEHADSEWKKAVTLGKLNPLPMTHATIIGKAGQFYRALAATSWGGALALPSVGGLRELKMIDEDLSSGATVVHRNDILMTASPMLQLLDADKYVEYVKVLYEQEQGKKLTDEQAQEIVESLFGKGPKRVQYLYALPYKKVEQITQRLKNTIGSRPAIEVSPVIVGKILGTLGATEKTWRSYGFKKPTKADEVNKKGEGYYSPDDIVSGKLRRVLPQAQFEEMEKQLRELEQDLGLQHLKQGVHSLEVYRAAQTYFRQQILDPSSTKRGFIGPTEMRRVAINAGLSLLGDFTYNNAAYTQMMGRVQRTRTKLNPSQLENVLHTQALLGEIFQGAIVTSRTMEVEETQIVDGVEVTRTRKLNPGMWIKREGKLYQVGTYDKPGYIALKNLGKFIDIAEVKRLEGINIKLPGFSNREQGAVATVIDAPRIIQTTRGTMQLEVDFVEAKDNATASRALGGGLAKGPMVYLEGETFEAIQEKLDSRHSRVEGKIVSHKEYMEDELQNKQIYSYTSFGTFKGYNSETGLYLLSSQKESDALKRASGVDIARSLALMLVGDKEVKKALVKSLEKDNLLTAALAVAGDLKGLDVDKNLKINARSDDKISMASPSAVGLALLGDATKPFDLDILKQRVIAALDGEDPEAAKELARRAVKLFDLAQSRGIEIEGGTRLLSEGDPISRGAGLLAHSMYFSRQVFAEVGGLSTTKSSVSIGGLYDIPFINFDLLEGKVPEGVLGYSREDYISNLRLHTKVEFTKEDPNRLTDDTKARLLALQARLDNDLVIENLVDISVSQALVPTGMKDTVKEEFQYLLGTSAETLSVYESVGGAGEDSVSIQQAYTMVMGVGIEPDVRRPLMYASIGGKKIGYTLALYHTPEVGEVNKGAQGDSNLFLDRKFFLMQRLLLEHNEKSSVSNQDYTKALLALGGVEGEEALQRVWDMNKETRVEGDQAADYDAAVGKFVKLMSKIESGESQLGQNLTPETLKVLSSMKQDLMYTKQLVLPQFDVRQNRETGLYNVGLADIDSMAPKVGVLLGYDIMQKAALAFGEHKDEILTTQVMLRNQLLKNQALLEKVSHGPTTLTQDEVVSLQTLEDTVELSRQALFKLVNTEMMKQAYGDHTSYAGVVGIAVNSYALAPSEFLAGERYARTMGDSQQIGQYLRNSYSLFMEGVYTAEEYTDRVEKFAYARGDEQAKRDLEEGMRLLQTEVKEIKSITGKIQPTTDTELLNRYKRELAVAAEAAKVGYISKEGMGLSFNEAHMLSMSRAYSMILGIDQKEILQTLIRGDAAEIETLNNWIPLVAGGSIKRTGIPAGASARVIENFNSAWISLDQMKRRVQAMGDAVGREMRLMLDEGKFRSGLVVPSLSRLISGLGDYDGDSYALIFNTIGQHTNSLVKDQKRLVEIARLKKKLTSMQEKLTTTEFSQTGRQYDIIKAADRYAMTHPDEMRGIEIDDSKGKLYIKPVIETRPSKRAISEGRRLGELAVYKSEYTGGEPNLIQVHTELAALKATSSPEEVIDRVFNKILSEKEQREIRIQDLKPKEYKELVAKHKLLEEPEKLREVGLQMMAEEVKDILKKIESGELQEEKVQRIVDKAYTGEDSPRSEKVDRELAKLIERSKQDLSLSEEIQRERKTNRVDQYSDQLKEYADALIRKLKGDKQQSSINKAIKAHLTDFSTAAPGEEVVLDQYMHTLMQEHGDSLRELKEQTYDKTAKGVVDKWNFYEAAHKQLGLDIGDSFYQDFTDLAKEKGSPNIESLTNQILKEFKDSKKQEALDIAQEVANRRYQEGKERLGFEVSNRRQRVIAGAGSTVARKVKPSEDTPQGFMPVEGAPIHRETVGADLLEGKYKMASESKAEPPSVRLLRSELERGLKEANVDLTDLPKESPQLLGELLRRSQANLTEDQQNKLLDRLELLGYKDETQKDNRLTLSGDFNDERLRGLTRETTLYEHATYNPELDLQEIVHLGSKDRQYTMSRIVDQILKLKEDPILQEIGLIEAVEERATVEKEIRDLMSKQALTAEDKQRLDATSGQSLPARLSELDDKIEGLLLDKGLYGKIDEEYDKTVETLKRGEAEIEHKHDVMDKIQSKVLDDLKDWGRIYTGLPSFITDPMDVGEVMGLISQKFDTKPFKENADSIQQDIEEYNAMRGLLEQEGILDNESRIRERIEGLSIDDSELVNRLSRNLMNLKGDLDEDTSRLLVKSSIEYLKKSYIAADELIKGYTEGTVGRDQLDRLNYITEKDGEYRVDQRELLEEALRSHYALAGNTRSVVQGVSGALGAAVATLIDPFEFDVQQATIGLGGTSLIGDAYNTMIPLLDQLMLDTSILAVTKTKYKEAFVAGITEHFRGLEGEHFQQFAEEMSKLGTKEGSDTFSSQVRERYHGTTGLLMQVQQIVRDALKAKEGGSILEVIQSEVKEGKRIIDLLRYDVPDTSTPLAENKQRLEELNTFLRANLGSDINTDVFLETSTPTYGLTGFGALLLMSDYTRTQDKDIMDSFIGTEEKKGLFWDAYKERIERETDSFDELEIAKEVIGKGIINLVEKTQASFSASSSKDKIDSVLTNALGWHTTKEGDTDSLNRADKRTHRQIDQFIDQASQLGVNVEDGDVDRFLKHLSQTKEGSKLKEQMFTQIIYNELQRRNADDGVFNLASLEYLRGYALANLEHGNPETPDIADKMTARDALAYNAYIDRSRRGKVEDFEQGLFGAASKIEAVQAGLEQYGYTPETIQSLSAGDAEKLLYLTGMAPGLNSISTGDKAKDLEIRRELATFLLKSSQVEGEDMTYMGMLQASSAGLAKMTQYFSEVERLSTQAEISEAELNYVDELKQKLAGVISDGEFDVNRILDLQNKGIPIGEQIAEANRILRLSVLKTEQEKRDADIAENRLKLNTMKGAETIGILASPLLLALATNDVKPDARFPMLLIDVLSASAELEGDKRRIYAQVYGKDKEGLVDTFQVARLRSQLMAEGLVFGTIQGIVQESIYKGVAHISHAIVGATLGKIAQARPNVGTIGAAIATEILSTIAAQGIARAAIRSRGVRGGLRFEDPMARVIRHFIETVWQGVLIAQEELLNLDYEVIDTEENMSMDFETSGIPSEVEWDIESGFVVLDADGEAQSTEFEDTDYNSMASVSAVAG